VIGGVTTVLAGLLCSGALLCGSKLLLQRRALFIRREPNLPPVA